MMRSYQRLWFLVLILMAVDCRLASATVSVGDKVKEFTLDKHGGGSVRFPHDVQGKVIFLNFWASWCPECRIEMPELVKIKERYKDQPFVLIAVNIDRKRKPADKFLKKMALDLLVLYDTDGGMIQHFGPMGIPASYLIGPDGTVKKNYLGFNKGFIERYGSDIDEQLKKVSAPW